MQRGVGVSYGLGDPVVTVFYFYKKNSLFFFNKELLYHGTIMLIIFKMSYGGAIGV
jgi:hypothetical protein